MPFQIIRNDITKVTADAIVNTANPKPVVGGGTDTAIYQAAGAEQLLAEREKIGDIAPGNAVQTPAFNLNAKYIIHTVGPVWIDGTHGEREILHSCYEKSLNLAAGLNCESIAFPLIASGTYGFPKDEALEIALAEIQKFLLTHEMEVILVVFDRKALRLSKNLLGDIEEYIDEHSVSLLREAEYERQSIKDRLRRISEERREAGEKDMRSGSSEGPENIELFENFLRRIVPRKDSDYPFPRKSHLDEILSRKEDTFQQRLFKLIDERHMSDPEVYKKANIDRKVFSKIRCNENYHPKKKTAVAFAIALELDMPTMKDLLSRAEIAFSPSSKFDLIVSYFVDHKIYDIYQINAALFEYDQELLGY